MARRSTTGIQGLYKRADGRWRLDLRWRDPVTGEPRRHQELMPAATLAGAAKERARRVLNSAKAGTFDPNREPGRKLHQALEGYETWAEQNRPASKRGSVIAQLKLHLADVPLEQLSPFMVEKYRAARTKGGAAPGTFNRSLAALKHACGLWAEWGWMPADVAQAVRRVPRMKEPPGRVRYLTDAEWKALVASLEKHRILPVLRAAALSGMRRGELLALRKADVDLPRRMVTLPTTKANKVRRVPVNDDLAPILEAAIKSSPGDYVFTSRLKAPYTGSGFAAIFRRALDRAGLENLHFHDVRHDFATRLRAANVGIDVIAQLLGHSSLAMAQRYAHVQLASLTSAVASLQSPAAGPAPVASPLPHTRKGKRRKPAKRKAV